MMWKAARMGEISVDPAWLSTPGDRFRRIASELAAAAGALATVVGPAAGSAGSGEVAAGCATFTTGVASVLSAFAEDTTLLRDKVVQAAVTYGTVEARVAAGAAGAPRRGPEPR
jgi:hypothetical protein